MVIYMDFDTLYTCTKEAWLSFWQAWPEKLLVGSMAAAFQLHAELLTIFTALVVLDLATRWIALAKPLTEHGEVWEEICMIPEAHRRGIISSYVMRTRFVSKMCVYLLVTATSGMVDMMFRDMGSSVVPWLQICVGYLAAVELKSVLENLNDAGVVALDALIEKVKRFGERR